MTAPIISPTLVRRYLLAMGWAEREQGILTKSGHTVVMVPASTSHDIDYYVVLIARIEEKRSYELVARLALLAAAEMFLETIVSGPTTAKERAFYVQTIETAGLTPEAWEEAKGR